MPVTDKDLSIIKAFKNLEHVNLNFSAINRLGIDRIELIEESKVSITVRNGSWCARSGATPCLT